MPQQTYIGDKFTVGMAPIATIALPNAYTSERYRIVLNFPKKLSDIMAPKTHMKKTIVENV